MQNHDNKSMESDSETGAIAVCALRYCMGRRTYMPSLVIDWVKRHWHSLSTKDKTVIARDLRGDFEAAERVSGVSYFGDKCDFKTWKDFYEWINAQG